ncbi:MAG: hypothetical protein CMK59_09905 [Proteobacteria bacterium]|nr:hypothetical protein [Pseudomonadota bacterium]
MKHATLMTTVILFSSCLNFHLKGDSIMPYDDLSGAESPPGLEIDSFTDELASNEPTEVFNPLSLDFDGRTLFVEHTDLLASCEEVWGALKVDFNESNSVLTIDYGLMQTDENLCAYNLSYSINLEGLINDGSLIDGQTVLVRAEDDEDSFVCELD